MLTLTALSLTGCATDQLVDECPTWVPIRPSHSDVLTTETKKQILLNNCNWADHNKVSVPGCDVQELTSLNDLKR